MRITTLTGLALAAALAGGPARLLATPTEVAHTVRDVCVELEPRLAPVEAERAEEIKRFCKAHGADELTTPKREELRRLTKGFPELQMIVARFEEPVEEPVQ